MTPHPQNSGRGEARGCLQTVWRVGSVEVVPLSDAERLRGALGELVTALDEDADRMNISIALQVARAALSTPEGGTDGRP